MLVFPAVVYLNLFFFLFALQDLSYCIPTILASAANSTAMSNPIFASASNSASRAFGDLFTCWYDNYIFQ